MTLFNRSRNNQHRPRERGAALVELGLAVPIFLILLAAIFDLGLAFNASRSTDETARSAARAAAAAGPSRLADLRAIDTVRAQYANSLEDVTWLTVYRSPVGGEGGVPDDCKPGGAGLAGTCNVYDATQIGALSEASFAVDDCVGDPDENWCPTTRTEEGPNAPYLGVAIWVDHEPTLGFMLPDTEFTNDAVFRVETIEDFVPPEVVTVDPSVTAGTTTTPTVETTTTPDPCGLNLYDNTNQGGWYLYVDDVNEGNLGAGYDNDGSSFHVDGGCNVAVSTEYDGGGECQVLAAGSSDPDLQAPWRNTISWVDVDGSCPAIATATPMTCAIALYDNSNFAGWSFVVNDTASLNLGAGYNNDASSFIVDTGCDVAVSTDPDGGGNCTILAAGTQNADLQAPWRNTISW